MSIKLKVVTPDGIFIDDREVDIVNLQTIDGDMGIMGNMVPIISALTIGTLSFRDQKGSDLVRVHVHRGILEVTPQQCKIITERLYLVDENLVKQPTPAKYQ